MDGYFDLLDTDVFELLLIALQKARMKRVLQEIIKNSTHYWCWRSKSVIWPHLNKISYVTPYVINEFTPYYVYYGMEYHTYKAREGNIVIMKRCIVDGICSNIYKILSKNYIYRLP